MHTARVLGHVERVGRPLGERRQLEAKDARRHAPAAPVDLVLEEPVGGLEEPRARLGLGDERAVPLAADDEALLLEPLERLPDAPDRDTPNAVHRSGSDGIWAPACHRPPVISCSSIAASWK